MAFKISALVLEDPECMHSSTRLCELCVGIYNIYKGLARVRGA